MKLAISDPPRWSGEGPAVFTTGEACGVLEGGPISSAAQLSPGCQEASGLLPGDSDGSASLPTRLAQNLGTLHPHHCSGPAGPLWSREGLHRLWCSVAASAVVGSSMANACGHVVPSCVFEKGRAFRIGWWETSTLSSKGKLRSGACWVMGRAVEPSEGQGFLAVERETLLVTSPVLGSRHVFPI